MKRIQACLGTLAISLLVVHPAMADRVPAQPVHHTSQAEQQAIGALLASYTRCVTQGDEAGFRALLLDEKIPFSSVQTSSATGTLPDLHRYEDFRQAVFSSGQRYRQKFYNIRIEQDGPLAQVSLDFVTEQISGQPQSSYGWKVLQLVKIGDHWKIASELYTF